MNNHILRVEHISKSFQTKARAQLQVLQNVSLSLKENEFVCLVGTSGCGKSTLLRMIAGLEGFEKGHIFYGSEPIHKPHAEIGMVFQEYSLLPWRTVADNVSLGLEFATVPKKERQGQAMHYLELVGLQDFAKALPHELSGGMRQRVAIARALANKPKLLLMDEPFGALDAYTRILLQRELLRIGEKQKTTVIFVTHSVDEAVYLADRVLVMSPRPGRVIADIPIHLPHPRERAHVEFGRLTSEILALLDSRS